MFPKTKNANCKILVATDSDKQKRRLMGYLVAAGYRTQCVSATALLVNSENLRINVPELVILDLDSRSLEESLARSTQYAAIHDRHFLYSLDASSVKQFKSIGGSAGLPYVTNNCGMHELELGIEVTRLKAATEKNAREQRREQWALQALSFVWQRSDSKESALDGIVAIIATALDSACGIVTKDPHSDSSHTLAFAGTKPDERNARLITPIATPSLDPSFLCVWSKESRTMSDAEETLIAFAAHYSGLAISDPFSARRALSGLS